MLPLLVPSSAGDCAAARFSSGRAPAGGCGCCRCWSHHQQGIALPPVLVAGGQPPEGTGHGLWLRGQQGGGPPPPPPSVMRPPASAAGVVAPPTASTLGWSTSPVSPGPRCHDGGPVAPTPPPDILTSRQSASTRYSPPPTPTPTKTSPLLSPLPLLSSSFADILSRRFRFSLVDDDRDDEGRGARRTPLASSSHATPPHPPALPSPPPTILLPGVCSPLPTRRYIVTLPPLSDPASISVGSFCHCLAHTASSMMT